MPINEKQKTGEKLYQRELYNNGGISKWYWDYKDGKIIQAIPEDTKSIMDLGCGEGILLEKLTNHFPNASIMGVDFIPENIEICKKIGLNAVIGDLYNLDFPDNSWDTVLLIEVIEHLENPDSAINELFRVLKPGGTLVILFPNDFIFFVSRLLTLKFKQLTYDPGHVKQWTHFGIRNILSSKKFEKIKSISIPFLIFPLSLHGLVAAQKPQATDE